MSKYIGLFTFDEDTHKYIPIEQAQGIIKYKEDCKSEGWWFRGEE